MVIISNSFGNKLIVSFAQMSKEDFFLLFKLLQLSKSGYNSADFSGRGEKYHKSKDDKLDMAKKVTESETQGRKVFGKDIDLTEAGKLCLPWTNVLLTI